MNPISPSVPQRKHGVKAWLTAVWHLLSDPDRLPLYFVLAALLTFLVESLSRHSPIAALGLLIERPFAYLTNYCIILLTILPGLLFRKRTAGVTLLSMIWVVLGVAQCVVLMFRVTPLTAVDVAIALSVITIIDRTAAVRAAFLLRNR